jgi:hypothetical protein
VGDIMERKNRYDGLHPAAASSIRYHAKRLAGCNAVPGMDLEDYEQHLALQLLRKSKTYDDGRASYATFADRVVRSQSASLASATAARSHEQAMLSLDDILPSSTDDGDGTLHDLLPGNGCVPSTHDRRAHDVADLRVDLARSTTACRRPCVGAWHGLPMEACSRRSATACIAPLFMKPANAYGNGRRRTGWRNTCEPHPTFSAGGRYVTCRERVRSTLGLAGSSRE